MLKLCQMGRCKAKARMQAQPVERYPDGGALFCLFRVPYCLRAREVQFPAASPVSGAYRFRAAGISLQRRFSFPGRRNNTIALDRNAAAQAFRVPRLSSGSRTFGARSIDRDVYSLRPVILLASVLPV